MIAMGEGQERESDMHDEKKKDITGEEESARAQRDVASLKCSSQLFPCHPFPSIQSSSLAVRPFRSLSDAMTVSPTACLSSISCRQTCA